VLLASAHAHLGLSESLVDPALAQLQAKGVEISMAIACAV